MGAFQNAAQKNTAVAPSGNGGVFSRVASKQPVAPKENNMLQKFAQNVIARPAIRLGQATGAGLVELFGNEQQKSRIPQALAQPIKTSYLGTTAGVKPIGKGGGKQIALDAGKSAFDIASLGAGTAVNTALKTGAQKTASALLPKATSKVGSFVARNAPGVVANAVEGVAYNTGYNALNQKPLTENMGTAAALGVVAPPLIKGLFKGGQKVVGTFNKDIRAERLTQKRLTELNKLNKLKTLSTVVEKGRERGIDIPKLLSETDVLHGSVDKNGTITTKGVGNAVEEYTNKYVAGNEATVSASLKKEGRAIAPQIVQKKLQEAIDNAGIEGASLTQAKKKIKDELDGYLLRSQDSGAIPVSTLHDAKVDKYNGINFFTEGATKKYDKTIAKALKELVEEYTTDVKVKEINRELSKHFAVIDYLERLDGRKVEGGRLGKYFARTVGAIVGGNMGPLGAVVGAEAGGLAKGQMMSRVFSGKTGKVPVQAKAITEAADYLNTPAMGLPQSSKSFGNRNINQSTTITPTNTSIPKMVPQLPKKSSDVAGQDMLTYIRSQTTDKDWENGGVKATAKRLGLETEYKDSISSGVSKVMKEKGGFVLPKNVKFSNKELLEKLTPSQKERFLNGTPQEQKEALAYLRLKYDLETNDAMLMVVQKSLVDYVLSQTVQITHLFKKLGSIRVRRSL